ncbi:MAG TPA: tetratricopeptide repeat protein, partial [Nevskiaceae bacterium]|nr:tetratricopeptide repeat protein [Nevskiaceae bacterium]
IKKQPISQPQPTPGPSPILISESSDIRKVVWQGAVEIWKNHPIFGTGPETFAYSYYWYRPREHNDLSEWDFLYNKAHNEYLNFAATTGTVGLASYLLLIGWFLTATLKNLPTPKAKNFLLTSGLLAGYTSILVTNFFGFSVVAVSLLFFLFPAMTVVFNQKKPTIQKPTKNISPQQWFTIATILLFTFYFLYFILSYWYADFQFARAEKFNKNEQHDFAFNTLQLAIRARPQEPIYHDELAWTATNLAVSTSKKQDATLSSQLVDVAIIEQDLAIKISPYNLNFWKNRTKIFYQLSRIDEQYYQEALVCLLQATDLAPTDPKIKYNLALFYAGSNQIDTAIKTLKEAVNLKPNYEDAHYALALFYEQSDEKEKAKEHLEYILENINPQSQRALEKLEKL